MGKTRGGIYLNLLESEYIYNDNSQRNITYYFSSKFYMESFLKKREEYREKLESYIYYRSKLRIDAHTCSDIVCYSDIEKRGFYVIIDNVPYGSLTELHAVLLIGGGEVGKKTEYHAERIRSESGEKASENKEAV
jgi:hypothetical protein|nr:MAG TPA: transcriptional regulator [Caudoviricetes sp.]